MYKKSNCPHVFSDQDSGSGKKLYLLQTHIILLNNASHYEKQSNYLGFFSRIPSLAHWVYKDS